MPPGLYGEFRLKPSHAPASNQSTMVSAMVCGVPMIHWCPAERAMSMIRSRSVIRWSITLRRNTW